MAINNGETDSFLSDNFQNPHGTIGKPATVVVKAGVLGTVRAPYLMVKIMLSEGNRSELILFQVGKPLQSIHQYA